MLDEDGFANVEIDIAVVGCRGFARTALAQQVADEDGRRAECCSDNDLGGAALSQMGAQGADDGPKGQHEEVKRACQQLCNDKPTCQQPPDGGMIHT